jgi:hypothetical protein
MNTIMAVAGASVMLNTIKYNYSITPAQESVILNLLLELHKNSNNSALAKKAANDLKSVMDTLERKKR